MKIVDEKSLTWKQVLEFRHDIESQKRYKHFLHWMDKEMIGKSQRFVEDEMTQRLEDYENALKKYGIKTVLGTLQEIMSGEFLKSSFLASGIVALATDPLFGFLTETGLIVSNVAIKLAQKRIDYEEVVKGPNSEISWVYEVKKKLGGNK